MMKTKTHILMLVLCATSFANAQETCQWIADDPIVVTIPEDTTYISGICNISPNTIQWFIPAGSESRTWIVMIDIEVEVNLLCTATIPWDPLLATAGPTVHTATWEETTVDVESFQCYDKWVAWQGKMLLQTFRSLRKTRILRSRRDDSNTPGED